MPKGSTRESKLKHETKSRIKTAQHRKIRKPSYTQNIELKCDNLSQT